MASRQVVLARGAFISHEHHSTGTVSVLGLPDGSQVLRMEDLRTSNGPLLKVWLSDAAALDGVDGWAPRAATDAEHGDAAADIW